MRCSRLPGLSHNLLSLDTEIAVIGDRASAREGLRTRGSMPE